MVWAHKTGSLTYASVNAKPSFKSNREGHFAVKTIHGICRPLNKVRWEGLSAGARMTRGKWDYLP
jgi:hypothetical protein